MLKPRGAVHVRREVPLFGQLLLECVTQWLYGGGITGFIIGTERVPSPARTVRPASTSTLSPLSRCSCSEPVMVSVPVLLSPGTVRLWMMVSRCLENTVAPVSGFVYVP